MLHAVVLRSQPGREARELPQMVGPQVVDGCSLGSSPSAAAATVSTPGLVHALLLTTGRTLGTCSNRSRALYCYDCRLPLVQAPQVPLPFKFSIITHSNEMVGAMHGFDS